MVEFQDSASVELKKEKPNIIVKEDNSLRTCYSRCALNLDEARLRDILENIPSAVMVFEKPDGKITYQQKSS